MNENDNFHGGSVTTRETYVPWFPPCQPCGHCPACGRPTAPFLPPMYLPSYWPINPTIS